MQFIGQQIPVESYAERIFRWLDYRGDDGHFLWAAAELWRADLITEFVVRDASEGTSRCHPRNKVAYFRKCIENSVGGKEALQKMLSSIKVPLDRRGPPRATIAATGRRLATALPSAQPQKRGPMLMADAMAQVLAELMPGVVLGDDLPEPRKSFELERQRDPQRLIDELLDQNTRQAIEIERLKEESRRLQSRLAQTVIRN